MTGTFASYTDASNNTYKVCVDGMIINLSLPRKEAGDIGFFGHASKPNLFEKGEEVELNQLIR